MTTNPTFAAQAPGPIERGHDVASRAAFRNRQNRLIEAFDSLGERGKERLARDVGTAISKIYRCSAPHSELPYRQGDVSLDESLGYGRVSDIYSGTDQGRRSGRSDLRVEFAVKTPNKGLWESEMRESVRFCYRQGICFHGEIEETRRSEGRPSIWLPAYLTGNLAHDGRSRPMIITERVNGDEPDIYFDSCAHAGIPVPPKLMLDILVQMCAGVSEVHKIGMIHRDVKPNNFLLEEIEIDGERFVRAVLLDFDFVRCGPSCYEERHDGRVTGTPEFVAPEIFTRQVYTKMSDVYALGISIFNVLTDKLPFPSLSRNNTNLDDVIERCRSQHLRGGFSELPKRMRGGILELPARIHAGLARIISKATSLCASDRYQCGGEMLLDMEHLAEEE